jgi:cytochrome P450
LNKDPFFYGFLDGPDAAFGTSSFTMHRQRRKAFNKFFSPSALNALESQVQKNVKQLVVRLEAFRGTQKPVKIGNAFRSLARDIISEYAMPEGFHLLESEDMGEDLNLVNRTLSGAAVWNRHFRWVFPLMNAMPEWMMNIVATPGVAQLMKFNTARQFSPSPSGAMLICV